MPYQTLFENWNAYHSMDEVLTETRRAGAVLKLAPDGTPVSLSFFGKGEGPEERLPAAPPRNSNVMAALAEDNGKYVFGLSKGKERPKHFAAFRERGKKAAEALLGLESLSEGDRRAAEAYLRFLGLSFEEVKAFVESLGPLPEDIGAPLVRIEVMGLSMAGVFSSLPEEALEENLDYCLNGDRPRVRGKSCLTGKEAVLTRGFPKMGRIPASQAPRLVCLCGETRTKTGPVLTEGFETEPDEVMGRCAPMSAAEASAVSRAAEEAFWKNHLDINDGCRLAIIDAAPPAFEGMPSAAELAEGFFNDSEGREGLGPVLEEALSALRRGAPVHIEERGFDPDTPVSMLRMFPGPGRMPVELVGRRPFSEIASSIGRLHEALNFWHFQGFRKRENTLSGCLVAASAAHIRGGDYKEALKDHFQVRLREGVYPALFLGVPVPESFVREASRRLGSFKKVPDSDKARHFSEFRRAVDLACALEGYNEALRTGRPVHEIMEGMRDTDPYRLGTLLWAFGRIKAEFGQGNKKGVSEEELRAPILVSNLDAFRNSPSEWTARLFCEAMPRLKTMEAGARVRMNRFIEGVFASLEGPVPRRPLTEKETALCLLGYFNGAIEYFGKKEDKGKPPLLNG